MRDALAVVEVFLEAPAEFHFVDVARVEWFREGLGKAAVILVEESHIAKDKCQGGSVDGTEGKVLAVFNILCPFRGAETIELAKDVPVDESRV